MTKAQIIERTLRAMSLIPREDEPPCSDEPHEEGFITSVLQDRLPEGVEIETCEDFKHFGVECCDTCHNFYPHYEMKVIKLPDGSPAWVCDAVEWAIYPERHRDLENSKASKLLREIFGEDVDE